MAEDGAIKAHHEFGPDPDPLPSPAPLSLSSRHLRSRLLVLAEGRVERGHEEEAKLAEEFRITLRHMEKCVKCLADAERDSKQRIFEQESSLVRRAAFSIRTCPLCSTVSNLPSV